jgi:hypothetical protein
VYDESYERHPLSILCALIHNEARTYDLLESVQGRFIPKFHGLYVFAVLGRNRNAWLLLRQYIPGTPLDQMDPDQLSTKERANIMDKVFDAAYQMYEASGVLNCYFAPRNFILYPAELERNTSAPTPSTSASRGTIFPSSRSISTMSVYKKTLCNQTTEIERRQVPFQPGDVQGGGLGCRSA